MPPFFVQQITGIKTGGETGFDSYIYIALLTKYWLL